MKKIAVLIGVSVCLLSLFLAAGVTQAKDLDKQAALLASCQMIRQYLTLPPETSAEQRALVALNMAGAQSRSLNQSVEVEEALRNANTFTTYLLTSDTSYFWSTDHWEGIRRSIYTYSGITRTDYVVQTWDGAQWVNNSRRTFTYDSNGNVSTMTDQLWDTNDWVNQFLFIMTNDSNGNLTQMLLQSWTGSVWMNYIRETITYSGGNLAIVITEMWQTSAWVGNSKIIYTYSGGDLTEVIVQSWVGSVWVNQTRTAMTYNGSGGRTESVMYLWQGGVWVNASLREYTYDGSGNEILELYSIWNISGWMAMEADTSKWSDGKNTEIVYNHLVPPSVSRKQYTYDTHGNLTVDLGQNWLASTWVNTDRAVYVYQSAIAVPCGDVNATGDVDIADAVYLIAYIFSEGTAPDPSANSDVDCSGKINIADIVYLINYIFRGGPAPCDACP